MWLEMAAAERAAKEAKRQADLANDAMIHLYQELMRLESENRDFLSKINKIHGVALCMGEVDKAETILNIIDDSYSETEAELTTVWSARRVNGSNWYIGPGGGIASVSNGSGGSAGPGTVKQYGGVGSEF